MTTGYTPQPGTLAARAVAHFATLPPAAELTNNVLADALAVDPNILTPCLQAAVRARLLERFKTLGRVYWRRGHGGAAPVSPPPAPAEGEDDETCGGSMPGEPITRILSAAAAPPIDVPAQSWCPPAAASSGSSDEPAPQPPSPPAPRPFGLGWKAPRTPVFLADAPPAAAPEPARADADRVLVALERQHADVVRQATAPTPNDETVQALSAALAPQSGADRVVDAEFDPDFLEVGAAVCDPVHIEPKPADPPAAPSATNGFRCALWSDGTLEIVRSDREPTLLSPADARALVRYVSDVLSARVRAVA